MFNRAKKTKNSFFSVSANGEKKIRNKVKNKCLAVAYMQKLEYAQGVYGRCVQFRFKKGNAKSILLQNRKYGVQVRVIISNPRAVVLI